MWHGSLLAIHTTTEARAPMRRQESARLLAGQGIEGDRYVLGTGTYSSIPDIREVTLIESESLAALKRDHDIDLSPDEHRRNLTTEGVPLNHLVGRRFRVGSVVLEGGRLNVPCRLLELVTGKKVYEPLIHRSGLNCRIIEGGDIRPGDRIEPA
ncbi:MOSC domain-containing protein [Frigidibacter sp. ROC022]|uniref:MOSC domain-containing protein n=1 Tax=Frigidibacter sp. ROC022 TaxID=2971796 RepID=UPI00215B6A05|nr:MOSC domain-containing protein [Frigidibacter sp. ROC022]MCR8724059.1 MOSC domain-containing protein [Frigidibacter sp. ROC022]